MLYVQLTPPALVIICLHPACSCDCSKIIPLAFSEQGTAPIHTAIAVLELTDQSLAALLPDQGGMLGYAGASIPLIQT